MLTLLPPLICMLCCSWYGFSLSGKLENRAKLLSEHSRLIASLHKSVIAPEGDTRKTLAEFATDSKQMKTLLGDILLRLSNSPNESLKSAYLSCAAIYEKQKLLTKEEIECVARALSYEEKLTRMSSAAVILAEMPRINEFAVFAEEKRRRDAKLIRSGGMLIGLMLLILLI
ncbi:MAG: hypothetical protein PHI27_08220 [Eubacteriales bacterium]|nr:hypothetical protein [Eubacteriales bacterium]MDD3882224.1 hypothetical protein [Eubacteriales bacterium]MDD4512573.1 hypothetical protein [Eubacteriales bacterium]